ncbi:hypothetical protein V8F20_001841 [Naviculisporaceae sp. PSN 640]
MGWFPFGPDDNDSWRLDIVALLAVTGESFIGEHAQALTSSKICMLPRIMPAPHALLQLRRPASLPSETAKVVGVYSGVVLDTVGFFANIIHPIDQLRPFDFQVFEIKHRGYEAIRSALSHARDQDHELGPTPGPGQLKRRQTVSARLGGLISNAPLLGHGQHRASGIPSFTVPLHLVSILSFFMTIVLIIMGVLWEDGTSLVAICLLSIATSVIGYAARWKPQLLGRGPKIHVPNGDVVIRTREGAFIFVKCTEEVARELYWGAQECNYMVTGLKYRIFMTISAVLMMPSVILLGNSKFQMQVLCGGAFLLLNVLYWLLGLLPLESSWDLSQFDVKNVTPPDAQWVDASPDDPESGPSFTKALWYVIRESKGESAWVDLSGAMPKTPVWRKWLTEAVENAKNGNRAWPAVARKNEIMKESYKDPLDPEEDSDSSSNRRKTATATATELS